MQQEKLSRLQGIKNFWRCKAKAAVWDARGIGTLSSFCFTVLSKQAAIFMRIP